MRPSQVAATLAALGYHVVPTIQGDKAASVKKWQQLRITLEDIPTYWPPDKDLGVGLLLGTAVSHQVFLLALDIDVNDDVLIRNVRLAFAAQPPAKKGSKGITYFTYTRGSSKKRTLRRTDPTTGAKITAIEILATGQQTILPPSLHPKGMNYEWIGRSLLDCPPDCLPEFTDCVRDEVELAVKNPSSPVFRLNELVLANEAEPGNVHDSILIAVAALVALGWRDEDILARVLRATRSAYGAAGLTDKLDRDVEVLNMIRDARAKGFDRKPKKEKPERIAAQWFIDEYMGRNHIYNRDGQFALYSDGSFHLHSNGYIRHLIATKFPEPDDISMGSAGWEATATTILDYALPFPEHVPRHRVCLANGTFDFDSEELLQWSPQDFLISSLDFDYKPDARCPVYDQFIMDTFADAESEQSSKRSVDVFEEFVAHSLFECLEYQKFLVIKGPPGSGKSTLTRITHMMHGERAVSAVPINEFGNERYRTAMVGKLLNVVSEVAATSHASDDFLKAVTSGDKVQVRFLYQEPQLVQLPTRLLIACNELFRVRDTSGAVERRMIILTCGNVVTQDQQDPKLIDRLHDERSGIFNRLVKAWHRLNARGQFLPPLSSIREVSMFTEENNHAVQWLRERTVQGVLLDDANAEVKEGETEFNLLYADFAEWNKMNGFKPLSSIGFGMKLAVLTRAKLDLNSHLARVGGRVVRIRKLTLLHQQHY